MKVYLDLIYGLIYGQLTGDALGGRYEFQSGSDAAKSIVRDTKGSPPTIDILGGGPFSLYPGQVTDDSELALCILYVISKKRTYDKDEVAKMYKAWLNSEPFDIGIATRGAFTGANTYQEMVNNSIKRDNTSQFKSMSNGALMRASPIALAATFLKETDLFKIRDSVVQMAIEDARITHSAPEVHDANAAFVGMLVDLLAGDVEVRLVVQRAMRASKTGIVGSILNSAFNGEDPKNGTPLPNGDKVLPDGKFQGYFGIALHNAVYRLLHGRSFFRSMIDTIRLGGDTDTNCAICGALLGAYYGYNSIPQRWADLIPAVPIKPPNRKLPPPVPQRDVNAILSSMYIK